MSYLTDVTMILTDWRDRERFEELVEKHEGYRPARHESSGGKAATNYVYCLGVNYAKPELLDALVEGPWHRGSVLYLEREYWPRPLVKVYGDVPANGWAEEPEMAWW
jgi:hypothetical protein